MFVNLLLGAEGFPVESNEGLTSVKKAFTSNSAVRSKALFSGASIESEFILLEFQIVILRVDLRATIESLFLFGFKMLS